MQTTTLRVRVSSPNGFPVAGATVQASLKGVGVSLLEGYVDLSIVNATTDADGIAELALWPSVNGTTGVEYRIVARSVDGRRLIDESLTVPESEVPVWLHDIVMTPPPTPKPYDEAGIEAIQQNRILAQNARDGAYTSAQGASSARQDVLSLKIQVDSATAQTLAAKDDAEIARQATSSAANTVTTIAQQVSEDREASATSSNTAVESASTAQQAKNDITTLYGDAQALSDAKNTAEQSAASVLSHWQEVKDKTEQAINSASSAAGSASQASIHRDQSSVFANKALLEAAVATSAAAVMDVVIVSTQSATAAAELARDGSVEAAELAVTRSNAALDRSADLIGHANAIYSDVEQAQGAAEQSVAQALSLYGDAQALSEAVENAESFSNTALASRNQAEQYASSAQSGASLVSQERINAQDAAKQAGVSAQNASDDRNAVASLRQQVGVLHATVVSRSSEVAASAAVVASHYEEVVSSAHQSSDDVAITYANRAIINIALTNNLIVLRG
ncbi:hypothetical protein [Vreelandella glaciei]|uniref:hypothetical protein n=1 Tax=Vreelandella glaciei TaxID=186761 RepID=UPI0030EF19E2